MSDQVGVVQGDIFLRHDPGWGHPESPERLKSIYGMLEQSGLGKELKQVKLYRASQAEICLIHSQDLYHTVEDTAGRNGVYLDGDTSTSPESFEAALYAAGSLIKAVDEVLAGRLKSCFALVRPPGHHAERDQSMGFCLFNNVAVAAAWALKEKGLRRILIADFDVHHGNATQHSFYDTDQVLYMSTHRYPFYPGTGHYSETGAGKGKGFNVNVPLPGGVGDNEFDAVYSRLFMPIAREYQPELIMVSAGYDAYHKDPLGGMRVTEAGFARLASIFLTLARELCNDRLVFTLEGGYSIDGITRCVEETLLRMLDRKPLLSPRGKPAEDFERLLKEVAKYQKPYWKGLRDD